ncbi:MAG: type II 3-dehydroquinate dehydratase [Oscillospiraceae bacterium]|nr:type II 3-dehydroquinate dehydratase [Oscillospiraceae bacterium]
MNKKILLINGPNMNMLGIRQPEIYGRDTLETIETLTKKRAEELGYECECFQSNYEGAIVEEIHRAYNRVAGIVMNPAAFTHYSVAVADAVSAVGLPVVEVHMSDIHSRESFRHNSVILPYCIGQVAGHGRDSYTMGVEKLVDHLEGRDNA